MEIHIYTANVSPVLYVLDNAENVLALWNRTERSCTLVSVPVADWNVSLSPWKAPALRKGEADFSGGADRFLASLSHGVRRIEAELPFEVTQRGIVGYSLAGLFALYAAITSDLFSLAASVSGSLWFPGWVEWLERRSMPSGKSVYLSLGNRESRAGNPVMRSVGVNTADTLRWLRRQSCRSEYEINPGGHFSDPIGRMAKAVSWLSASP